MSCRELIDSLRKAADERNRQIWKDAEAEAEQVKREVEGKLDKLRSEAAGKQAAMARDVIAMGLSRARNQARIVRLEAQQAVSARLYKAALSRLPALRNSSYASVFGKLVRELPPLDWKTVRVHPDDVSLARKHFPAAGVAADDAVTGGFEASTSDEAIRIINTFEKRLERAWVEIEPVVVEDIWGEVRDGTSSANAGPGISGRIPAVEDQGEKIATDQGLETPDP